MNDLLLHPKTASALNDSIANSAHAYLLTGPEGAGKRFIAHSMVCRLLGLQDAAALANHPYFLRIVPENNVITIQQIRDMQRMLQLRTTGKKALRRAVIISDAQAMTTEAQNALLKSLEEPPSDTLMVLTATNGNLRPTVISRCRLIEVLGISQEQANGYFINKGFSDEAVVKAFAVSGGYAGVMSALLTEKDDHELSQVIQLVKEILVKKPFDRLAAIDSVTKQKTQLGLLMQGLRLVCSAALSRAAEKHQSLLVKRWIENLQLIYETETALTANPNQKLLLTNLMLNL